MVVVEVRVVADGVVSGVGWLELVENGLPDWDPILPPSRAELLLLAAVVVALGTGSRVGVGGLRIRVPSGSLQTRALLGWGTSDLLQKEVLSLVVLVEGTTAVPVVPVVAPGAPLPVPGARAAGASVVVDNHLSGPDQLLLLAMLPSRPRPAAIGAIEN